MKRTRDNRVPLSSALPLSTPFVINVDPSSACDFKCKYCFQSKGDMPTKGTMQWSTYKRVIKQMGEFDKPIKTLRLYAFGEPLLNPNFAKMVQHAKENGVCDDVDTTTNASRLTPELSRCLINAGLDRINISIVGVNSDQYKEFSDVSLDFDKLVENIAYLYSIKKQCTVFIKINGDVISSKDKLRFRGIFELISDGIAIEHVMSCWDGIEVEKNKHFSVYGGSLTKVEVCPYIFYSMCVNFDGVVSACFLDWNRKLVIGNTNKNTLKEIWDGPAMLSYRRDMLLKKRHLIPVCKDCDQLRAGEPVNIDHMAEKLLRTI